MVNEIASALLPVFFVLALGYFAGWKGIVDNLNVVGLNRLVMMFAIPASLFVAISSTSRSAVTSHGTFIAVIVIGMLVVYALSLWLELKVFKSGRSEAAVEALTFSFPNMASIGLPLATAVVGDVGAIAVAIGLALGSMTISPLTLAILEQDHRDSEATGSTAAVFLNALGKSVRTPIFLAPVVAFALVLCGVHLPALVETTINPLGTAGAGAALFLTGLIVSAQKVTLDANVAVGVIIKNALMPLLVWGLCLLFGLSALTTVEAVLLTAIPSGFFGLVFGSNYGVRPRVAGSTVVLSTVASIVSLSVVIALLPKVA